jgi:hypothetical protein
MYIDRHPALASYLAGMSILLSKARIYPDLYLIPGVSRLIYL